MYTRLLRITVKNTDNELVATLFVPLTFKEDYNPLLENNQCNIRWELMDDVEPDDTRSLPDS